MIEIGATLNQRFLLEKELGRGGMGAVYSATDQLLQRKVAIKVLREQSGEEVGRRLRLEAQIAPGCCMKTWCELRSRPSRGGLLSGDGGGRRHQLFEAVAALAAGRAIAVLAQMAEALDYAHHQGVVHRDVKPAKCC